MLTINNRFPARESSTPPNRVNSHDKPLVVSRGKTQHLVPQASERLLYNPLYPANEAISSNGGSSNPPINNKIIDQLIKTGSLSRTYARIYIKRERERREVTRIQVLRPRRKPVSPYGINIVHPWLPIANYLPYYPAFSCTPTAPMDILRLRIVFQRCWIYRYESTCDCIKSRGRASGPDLAEVGEGRQIVRCSHIAHRARSPRLVILHCSSTSIFKSAPPPPCSFLPATTSSFYHLFVR